MAKSESNDSIKSVDTAFNIIEELREQGGAGVTDLAEAMQLPKSTVYNQLKTLEKQAFVVKDRGEYHLGLRFLGLGEFVREKKEVYRMIEPKVEEIAEKTDERAHFVAEEQRHAIHVHTKTGANAVENGTDSGTRRTDLHAVAAGKTILAYLPDDELERFLEENTLEAYTGNTITERERLFEELESVRDRGYAQNDEESMLGLRAVAAPILYPNGELLGVLSVSGPTHRLKGHRFEREIPDLLLGSSNEIEINVAHAQQSS
ncbi:IclR family transcriptional regulator [Halostella sp. JP-L12]|uniref:IclR family transcriptional regulator n=1 Tax=Halostella TaxID=1843185 RepID=UPI000EF80E06|nr:MULTISPECIES: IclR family transcriptional regulator [Halostella]NHN48097.1 IclR family transcriptional regulator [Halostella sp. JP-L12]